MDKFNPKSVSSRGATAPAPFVILFAFVSLHSAFLLFLVQPMVAKTILPYYGGSASVWTTCLLFFQTTLLAGYTYAHILSSRLSPSRQFVIHTAVLLSALGFLPFLPDSPQMHLSPVAGVLLTLLRHVGYPFFVLSTSAPLLQQWFYRTFPSRSPYPLYAVSNVGSIFAVLCYPFLFERLFSLHMQETLWGSGLGVFMVGCILCSAATVKYSFGADIPPSSCPPAPSEISSSSPGLWFGFSAAGSVLLLTTTEQISQDVAAAPLFWMIPLCIYLLTYVLCFSSRRFYRRPPWSIALIFATAVVAAELFVGGEFSIPLQLTMYIFTLSVGCMVAHGELSAIKPDAEQLTRFYLWTSAGGIFGGLLVAVAAPFLFPDLWEYSLLWPVLFFLVWRSISRECIDFETTLSSGKMKWMVGVGLVISAVICVVDVVYDSLSATHTSRNFYGRLTVAETPKTRCLYHGRTLHGCQPKTTEVLSPAFYYSRQSGVGVAYTYLTKETNRALRTGVVGLGVGVCAAWNRDGDHMRFYEINPAVINLANTSFHYLAAAHGSTDIVQGDARLALEAENARRAPQFDILVLDAFSSDAIPLHLLTHEAFSIYRKRITETGILAFHISNRHLNLEPLLLGAAKQLGWTAFITYTVTDYKNFILDSTWVILTNNPTFISQFRASDEWVPWPPEYRTPLFFTDQYSNILDLF